MLFSDMTHQDEQQGEKKENEPIKPVGVHVTRDVCCQQL